MTITYRRAQGSDFDKMVLLQNRYLGTNLEYEQKKDGFLSGEFSAAQFQAINVDVAVIVAIAEDLSGRDAEQNVIAFLCDRALN